MNLVDLPIHFLRPWWWLALLPLPAVLWLLARHVSGRAVLARLADAALLPHLVRTTGAHRLTALALVAVVWLCAVAALSGPAWQKLATPVYVNGAVRVVALSLSDDMLAQDLKPDRMVRARFAVRDLLGAAGDARTALVAYAGAAFTVAPVTDDQRTVLNLLRALSPGVMPVQGNDAAAGIRQSVGLLRQAHVRGGQIVLVTDTAGAAAVSAARAARARGVRVDVLGIGTTQGAPVPRSGGGFTQGARGLLLARRDDAALRAVAAAGGGAYAVLPVDGGRTPAFTLDTSVAGHAARSERAQRWRDGGIWLLPVLLVLGSLGFRRGWLLMVVALALPLMMPAAYAGSWNTWFTNRDQRALQALHQGDPRRAQRLATTPGIRGAADYRAGDYAAAATAFAHGDDARSRYNLGNALAKQGKYAKAVTAYRQALRRDPQMADARANLAAVEDWLRHHRMPPPQMGQTRSGAGGQAGQGKARRGSGSNAGRNRHRGAGDTGATNAGGGPSVSGAEQQQRQERRARGALARELQRTQRGSGPGGAGAQVFALGRSESRRGGIFSPQQRALLRSVPDDPGALLRRKFRLEWEQRGQQRTGVGTR